MLCTIETAEAACQTVGVRGGDLHVMYLTSHCSQTPDPRGRQGARLATFSSLCMAT